MTEGDYIKCRCGLIIAPDKMKMHLESEHFVKVFSDAMLKNYEVKK